MAKKKATTARKRRPPKPGWRRRICIQLTYFDSAGNESHKATLVLPGDMGLTGVDAPGRIHSWARCKVAHARDIARPVGWPEFKHVWPGSILISSPGLRTSLLLSGQTA